MKTSTILAIVGVVVAVALFASIGKLWFWYHWSTWLGIEISWLIALLNQIFGKD